VWAPGGQSRVRTANGTGRIHTEPGSHDQGRRAVVHRGGAKVNVMRV